MASEKYNLKNFNLIWLDKNVHNSKINIDTQEELRKSIKHPQTFEKVNTCEIYIRSLSIDDRVVLIVNDHLGQILVPSIHQLQQIVSIYIYDRNKKIEEEWTKKYTKVKNMITKLDDLIEQIRSNYSRRNLNKANELFVFNVFNISSTSEQSTTELNGQFVHAQLLINCLLRMKAAATNKDELISLSKKQYKDNENELALVREFEENYSADQALWWYTRESFLYRELNKALRMQNIDSLFVFRFFIRDIEKQLEQHQYSSFIRVFRGQLMSKEELNLLKDSVGKLISMNSFLSTSIDRQQALSFLYSSTASDHMQRVLFEIDADPQIEDVKSFANVTSLSYFPEEDEVLFMLGSIFRLVSIEHVEGGIWIFQLSLCGNSDPDLQAVFDHMKNEHGSGETTILSVGLILCQMGRYNEAEKYFFRLLNEMSPDHQDRGACYHNLGNLFDYKGDYESSLDWHHKALEIMMRTLPVNDPTIATSYNSIAAVRSKMGQYDQALESYLQAFEIWKLTLGEDHPNIAQCLSNVAGIQIMYERYSVALECLQKALIIYQKHLPTNHPQLGDLHNNIGIVHLGLDELDRALEYFNISLKIKAKCLPSQHPDIAMTLCNIGLIYEKKGEWSQALSHLKNSVDIFHHVLPPTHPTVIQVEQLLERVSIKSKIT